MAGDRLMKEARGWLLAVLLAMALATCVRWVALESFVVPTPSMEPAVTAGDRLLAEKVSTLAGREYRRGDILVFEDPLQPGRLLVKRVLAVGGDEVDIRDGRVWVDGEALDEPYVGGQSTARLPATGIYYPVTVPQGSLWVMGDNRGDSGDSRAFGPVGEASVRGRVLAAYWPPASAGPVR